MNVKQRFIKATEDWYRFVNLGHHKDRDCIFYINKVYKYSYGEAEPEWYWEGVQDGYVHEFYVKGDTEEDVMRDLTEFINNYII